MLTRRECYSLCSCSPQKAGPGLSMWWSQNPKGNKYTKASWGQAHNSHSFFFIAFYFFFLGGGVQIKSHGLPRLKRYGKIVPPEGRKDYMDIFAIYSIFFWEAFNNKDIITRLNLIHNLWHTFSLQTLLSARLLPCCSILHSMVMLSLSQTLPQKLVEVPMATKLCKGRLLLAWFLFFFFFFL